MKIVIIGGTGRIGSKLTSILKQQGHNVVAASPSSGVNTITGQGLDEALANAQAVVDVSNAPVANAEEALEFFATSTRNLIAAEKKHGVGHHVILSIVGVDRLQPKGYFRSKQEQEKLVKNSGVPYTIIQATQFFEFLNNIAGAGVKGDTIYLPDVSFQPIAVADVAEILASVATSKPENGTIAIAGPDKDRMAAIVGRYLERTGDNRKVLPDANEQYFGVELSDESLVPLEGSKQRIGKTKLEAWLG